MSHSRLRKSRIPKSYSRTSTNDRVGLKFNTFASLVLMGLPKVVKALPIPAVELISRHVSFNAQKHEPLTQSEFYVYMLSAVFLVLLGGVFAGLTLALMGQDEVYLKVISTSGTPRERYYAQEVLKLVGKGKHWLLVTLLLGNVITNETLPVILDRFLGGGFLAVFSSTIAIVIFGEIIPQSVSVRYGLQLGAYFAPFVVLLMYIMYPVAYPIAKLLDFILGQDHGTLYKKSGLKTLVTLHKTMGVERLNQDEVTIISAVLDLKEKSVGAIMTPIDKVYTMSSDTILNEDTVEEIFNAGFSRIPIHLPGEPTNFVGMLLVRVLISYDPEDSLPVSSFPLATLPETARDTSCLNILNYFQEGKSHMVVVSDTPGHDTGALGVLTLEDVIEELIGEEIVDESDVYVDLNKNIKRENPGPLSKRTLTTYLHTLYNSGRNLSTRNSLDSSKGVLAAHQPMYYPKRQSSDTIPSNHTMTSPSLLPVAGSSSAAIGHNITSTTANGIKPSNLAVNPNQTTVPNIVVKKQPALGTNVLVIPEPAVSLLNNEDYGSVHNNEAAAFEDDVHDNLVRKKNAEFKKFVLPEVNRNSVDLSDPRSISKGKGVIVPKNGNLTASSRSSSKGDLLHLSDSDSFSHRGSGIIESVVNVKGVSKTIIESALTDNEEERSDEEDSSNTDGDEAHNLMGGVNKSISMPKSRKKWRW
ncbi:unnamed protein product [Kuraishia capsulata CBS 1993]|uniref:CNNM transmembrane domain-containing protein n=1 Tax=Kuraishia capsulata CBS 1993 TaxID=1382522 RepID=W6MSV7_9ASCO|nr:uncharacterized protein KUCA_T00005436001 [Kuraishia capsulata CBS 1993]CDK29448.1 unnamed protein product [Kuraishia capsulata CBS 1993]